jgi:hypothetical protein
MTDWSNLLYYVMNVGSGVLLVALGALAAIRPCQSKRSLLPLFFMAWGIQLVLTNSAAQSDAAQFLYGVGLIVLPLQGLLLLYYVSQRSAETASTTDLHVLAACRAACLIVAACFAAGLVLLAVNPSWIFTVEAIDSSNYLRLEPLAALFYGPQFIGIALAVFLLALRLPASEQPRKDHLLVVGLALAWAYSLIYPLSYEVLDGPRHAELIIMLILATALVAVALPVVLIRWARIRRFGTVASGILIPAVAAVAWLAPFLDDAELGLIALAPGSARLLAAFWLVPALWNHNLAASLRERGAQARVFQVGTALASAIIAVVVVGIANFGPPVGDTWEFYARVLLLGTVGIVILGALPVRHLLLRGAAP